MVFKMNIIRYYGKRYRNRTQIENDEIISLPRLINKPFLR